MKLHTWNASQLRGGTIEHNNNNNSLRQREKKNKGDEKEKPQLNLNKGKRGEGAKGREATPLQKQKKDLTPRVAKRPVEV